MNQKTLKTIISYDGSEFFGYAKQPHQNTIQNKIESALISLGIIINKDNPLIASGRTDKGVHATYQVLSFKIPSFWTTNISKLQESLNIILSPSIYIKKMQIVHDNFHARYDAKKRVYRYIFSENVSIFEQKYITQYNLTNKQLFKQAIKLLEGTHNFRYFAKEPSDKNCIRTIYKTYLYEKEILNKKYYIFSIYSNGFLRNQIRFIVGFLFKLCNNEFTIDHLKSQLNITQRYNIKKAPPNGLYLSKVIY